MRIAILGLGEAGRRYATDLAAAGHEVTGYDPAPAPTPHGVRRTDSAAAAAAGADLVLGLTGARFAESAARSVASALVPGAGFADFNSAAPAEKRGVERVLATSGARIADVAVLAPVPRRGAATPLLVSGPGAALVAEVFGPLGAAVDVLDAPVGAAAGRKLLRSVFMKGLAAAVFEAIEAGAAAGCADWVREQIAAELGPDGPALVERLVTGTRQHAARRLHEVGASRDYLTELGTPTWVCDAAAEWLGSLAGQTEVAESQHHQDAHGHRDAQDHHDAHAGEAGGAGS